ncbi:MAG TPA: hypothetical protein VNZ52_08450 [Candidatus Thermoplasmatota archaeon]|nr:hypothetical protein [Candidatus Thermoplasmatota archaeon]
MQTVLLSLVAALLVAGPVLADDLANLHAEANVQGVDPAVDGFHTVDIRLYEGADGAPAAEVLVDGASPLP